MKTNSIKDSYEVGFRVSRHKRLSKGVFRNGNIRGIEANKYHSIEGPPLPNSQQI
jgi:hypothetical protein